MLNESTLIAFIPVRDVDRAMHFYSDVLGLVVTDCADDYCTLDADGTPLRLTLVTDYPEAQHTIVGWNVEDVEAAISDLAERGVAFNRYDGVNQTPNGLWIAPNGDQVVWFNDPDGNMLSITQFANAPVTSTV